LIKSYLYLPTYCTLPQCHWSSSTTGTCPPITLVVPLQEETPDSPRWMWTQQSGAGSGTVSDIRRELDRGTGRRYSRRSALLAS